MVKDGKIFMAKAGDKELYLLPSMANRHGLIAGATGTGKTITMKVMAESFSDMGVPVFFSDVKGDLTGMCEAGVDSADMQSRIAAFGLEGFEYKAYPVNFWDIFGEKGHPVRVTISGLGPMLLSRLLNLTDVQEGVLNIVFKVADDQGLLLLDMKDLRAMLQFVGDNRDEYTTMYGNVSTASIGAIQRALLAFEQEGGLDMFGEPELDLRDWIRTDINGRGMINVLSSARLFQSPTTYGTFLLWFLTELYEIMPEVGDLEKPRAVFFFDEAHCLFDDTPKALHQKIFQIIKLIRSKGVGVYFVTQNPSDIPGDVLGQLSNRIQHGLRAYTPAEQKGIKAAAESFRANDAFKTEDALMELGTGEALVSFLDEKGIPSIVEKAKILPPQSKMGAADEANVNRVITAGEFDLKYRTPIDRESAYEILMKATAQMGNAFPEAPAEAPMEAPVEGAPAEAPVETQAAAPRNATEAKIAEIQAAKAAKNGGAVQQTTAAPVQEAPAAETKAAKTKSTKKTQSGVS
ncbi:MAG: DUF853 family protein, partial [Parasporobacterium sp.]|nr:DUF853 family protein [Parasporobacterium sp.]